MMKWKNSAQLETPSEKNMQLLFLLAAGILEYLFITMESLFSYIGYYLTEDYIIVPCLLFVGVALTRNLTRSAKRDLCLSSAMVIWFVIVQIQHKISWMEPHPMGTVFFVYLMAFPFASVTEDGSKHAGLKMIGRIFVAASLVLVLYTVLLLLDCVPSVLAPYVYWDGARLHALWHPNIDACIFMIGIGLCMAFAFQAPTRGKKLLLVAAAVAQFMAMALTNCRTSLLMTSAFVGGVAFFAINKGGWKRFAAGLAVALVVMGSLFAISGTLYDLHTEHQIAKLIAQREEKVQEASKETSAPVQETTAATEKTAVSTEETTQKLKENKQTGEITISGENGQGTLSNDLRTLNGRTGIWKSALTAIRDNKSLLLWGTEYVGITISSYNRFDVVHAHNSWMEVLMRLGLFGLLGALVFTWIAVSSAAVLLWRRDVEMWKKIIAMLVLCIMVAGFLEPYLFITNVYYHFIDFMFLFCTGYLAQWREQLSPADNSAA